MYIDNFDTIIAQCSPAGSGAVGLIRVSGPHACAIIQKLVKSSCAIDIEKAASHTIHYAVLVDHAGERLDHVLLSVMRAPKTFTGEDVIEIGCHNNQFIIESIIESAVLHGARRADPGEFSQRAVLYGKMDLIQAESIHELICANNQEALKQALSQVEGTLSHWIKNLERDLMEVLSFAQASFEFIEEEQFSFDEQIRAILKRIKDTFTMACDTFDYHQHLKQGIKIGFIGATNAGKSSLFNLLIGRQKAIVTDIPGTTRDVLEATITRPNGQWTFVDTAGIRSTSDQIELLGIQKSHQQACLVDIIVLLYDGSRAITNEERVMYHDIIASYGNKIVLVQTKSDLVSDVSIQLDPLLSPVMISCVTKQGIDALIVAIEHRCQSLFPASHLPFVFTQRQYCLLKHCKDLLQELDPLLQAAPLACELIAHHIIEILAQLRQLTGKSISMDCMDHIFRQFCVGK